MQSPIDVRLAAVAEALAPGAPIPQRGAPLRSFVADQVGDDPQRLWLLASVLTATLPVADDVTRLRRRARLGGASAAVAEVIRLARTRYATRLGDSVEVLGGVIVDADHTARSALATGIQRVVRQTIASWSANRRFTLVGWDGSYSRLRRLSDAEQANALWGTGSTERSTRSRDFVVPWGGDYVLIELATETERTARLLALGRWSTTRVHIVGHDCVPITTAETVGPGMGGVFAKNLSAAAYSTSIATTSVASTTEYLGWRLTLPAIGLDGPRIGEVMLPTGVDRDIVDAAHRAAADAIDQDEPLLLSVGSHEPRKNHLAVLQAAEILWREGLSFRLTFVGGNSWGSAEFERLSTAMQEVGRPVQTLRGLSDDELWALYASASLTLFPSVNEGFGLPVAESLAMGVPVVTSAIGSMQEIAEAGGGAILVDPHDDDDLAGAIRSFLSDPTRRAQLGREAAARRQTSWDEYAAELWDYFGLGVTGHGAASGAV